MTFMNKIISALISALLVAPIVDAQTSSIQGREDREPEAATGYVDKKAVVAEKSMVSSANPYASMAGREVLKRGGSAIDAAVAVQAMLTLVEPQSSGIGGGAFILYWDNEKKQLHSFDGREKAPASADQYLFTEKGKPMKWRDAVVGGKSVGVPGVLKALELTQRQFGELEWSDLFTETITTAEQGFTVSARLHKLLEMDIHPGLRLPGEANRYFFPEGTPLQQGQKKKNPALAKTLTQIAVNGADYFYLGDLPKVIAETVQNSAINPGLLTATDFTNYNAVERPPVCGSYRGFSVCGMAPPSSGGINVLQILKTMEAFPVSEFAPDSIEFAHLYTQATSMAYADRAMYIADTDFTKLPFNQLISEQYLKGRAKQLTLKAPFQKATAGKLFSDRQLGRDTALEMPNTSHISIVDSKGNAISMTTSIEFMFGSGLMVNGFLLNNQLTDFSLNPTINGHAALNRVEPNKRPRSAMSPTIVFNRAGNVELVVGSPGGSRIISYVAQTLIGVLDWGLDIQQAINLPKITNRNDYTALEKNTPIAELESKLSDKGHTVRIIDLNSGLHGIQIKDGRLIGGADPRREGVAVGL